MAALNIPTVDQVIASALRKLGVLPTSYTYSADQFQAAAEALNVLIKEFQTLGMQAYLISTLTYPLVTGQKTYSIGEFDPVSLTPFPTYLYKVYLEVPNGQQIEMTSYPASDFLNLPFSSTGNPTAYNYLVGVQRAELVVWPTPDASVPANSRLVLLYQRQIDIANLSSDLIDFPGEWGNAVIYNLALLLSDEYGVPEQKKAWIEKQADKHLATALSNTGEQGSVQITPNGEGWDYPNQY